MARRLLIAAIVAISLGGPVVELFDSWDDTLKAGNDTEANVVVTALCIGVAFAIGTVAVAARIRALSAARAGQVIATRVLLRDLALLVAPVPASSPPTVLRV